MYHYYEMVSELTGVWRKIRIENGSVRTNPVRQASNLSGQRSSFRFRLNLTSPAQRRCCMTAPAADLEVHVELVVVRWPPVQQLFSHPAVWILSHSVGVDVDPRLCSMPETRDQIIALHESPRLRDGYDFSFQAYAWWEEPHCHHHRWPSSDRVGERLTPSAAKPPLPEDFSGVMRQNFSLSVPAEAGVQRDFSRYWIQHMLGLKR